jgi:uncharacterized membrane protein YfcA
VIGAVLVGVAGGVLAGLLGIGGGVLFVPGLALFLGLAQVDAQATSLVAIIPVALVGAWRQRTYGNVRITDALLIGALSVVGAVAGVALSNLVSERTLRIGFALLMLGVAGQLVHRALVSEGAGGASRLD